MDYTTNELLNTGLTLVSSFLIGVFAQFLKLKAETPNSNSNIFWVSLASGFSAMVVIGLLYEYTDIEGTFLISISGVAGWTGVSILSTFSKIFDQMLIRTAEKKLDVDIMIEEKEVMSDATTTRIGSQTE